jgi:RimJ/RimL family protein N-acetyltransferase
MEKIAYIIRRPDRSDLEKIIDFYLKEIPSSPSYKLIEDTVLFHITSTQDTPPTHFMIACKDDDILALSITRFSQTFKTYEIECNTKEALRRQGIAYTLITNSIAQCQKDRFFNFQASILPENTNSISLFKKLGFKLDQSTLPSTYQTYRLNSDLSPPNEK